MINVKFLTPHQKLLLRNMRFLLTQLQLLSKRDMSSLVCSVKRDFAMLHTTHTHFISAVLPVQYIQSRKLVCQPSLIQISQFHYGTETCNMSAKSLFSPQILVCSKRLHSSSSKVDQNESEKISERSRSGESSEVGEGLNDGLAALKQIQMSLEKVKAPGGDKSAAPGDGNTSTDEVEQWLVLAEEGADSVSESYGEDSSVSVPKKPASLMSLPELSRHAQNLVPYVNKSRTLQKLVQLGVDLSIVQEVDGIASLLVRSQFKRDIVPYIRFLVDIQVKLDKLGHVLTVNPHILTENLADLEERVGYLVAKNFSLKTVGDMITKSPVVMLMSPRQLDEKLGFLQQSFQLSGEEVRSVAAKEPSILPFKKDRIALCRTHVKEFLAYTNRDLKRMLLEDPQIFMTDNNHLVENYDYLFNNMMIPHHQTLTWPRILREPLHVISERHMFLLSLGRAKFDPNLENFISLQALASKTDKEFCVKIAKSDMPTFYTFLKTL